MSATAPVRRTVLRRLFYASLALGALLVIVLAALPTIAGGWVARAIEEECARRFAGRVVVGELSLAWFSRQRLERTTLGTPEGEHVATVAAELPSLVDLAGALDGKIGVVRVELEADLVADDAGRTNLERALAPRAAVEPAPSAPTPAEAQGEPFDLAAWLRRLDLDFALLAARLSWSDARTREAGAPLELRQVSLTAVSRPGEALRVAARGELPGGALELDARVTGLLQAPGRPFESLDARAAVRGFPAGLLDALALQEGRLAAQLGESFDLSLEVVDASLDAGTARLRLDSPRTRLVVQARLVDGVLSAAEPPLFKLETPTPRAWLEPALAPLPPPGARLSIESSERPSVVEASRCKLPVAWVLDPAARTDQARLARLAGEAELQLDASLPMRAQWSEVDLLARGVQPVVPDPSASLRIEPGVGASLHIEAEVAAGASGRLVLDAGCREPGRLFAGEMPPLDATLALERLPLALVDGFARLDGALVRHLGPQAGVELALRQFDLTNGRVELRVDGPQARLAAKARLVEGSLVVAGEDQLDLRWSPGAGRLQSELADIAAAIAASRPGAELAPLDGEARVRVAELRLPLQAIRRGEAPLAALRRAAAARVELQGFGLRYADDALRAEGASVAVERPLLSLEVEAGGAARARLECGLETGASGRLALDARSADWSAWLALDGFAAAPPLDASVRLDAFGVPCLEALVGPLPASDAGRPSLGSLLGPALDVRFDARGLRATSGALELGVAGQGASFAARAKLVDGKLVGDGEEPLRLVVRASEGALAPLVASHLPRGARWSARQGGVEFELVVGALSAPLPDFAAGATFDAAACMRGSAVELRAKLGSFALSDATLAAMGVDEVEVRSLELAARMAPGEAARADVRANLAAVEAFELALEASCSAPWELVEGRSAPLVLRASSPRLPGLALDRIAGIEGLWADLFGEQAALACGARLEGWPGDAPRCDAELELRASRGRVAFAGSWAGGRIAAPRLVEASLALDPERIAHRLASLLPTGQQAALSGAAPLVVRLFDVDYAPPGPGVEPLSSLADARARLVVELPELSWSDEALRAQGRQVALRGLRLAATLDPTGKPDIALEGEVVDEPAGRVSARLALLDPAASFAEPEGWRRVRARIEARVERAPTALVDILAAQDGLLVDALGPRVDVDLRSPSLSTRAGEFTAELRSPLHSVVARGRIEESRLVVDQVDGVVAQVGLGPLVSQRVVGKLVPTLVRVQKPQGATPLALRVDALTVPLDGDLRALDARLRLELGEVQYALLPGLEAWFPELAARSSNLPAIEVEIVDGVARYQRLPARIGGKDLSFSGSFDLVDGKLGLAADVPLSAFGKKVVKELEAARDYLPPDTLVPIELSGSWSAPKLRIKKQFLEDVVERAAKKALEDLFGGKDKKKP
ncbi:MAG: hypothetical protein ACK57N_07975 [Planctomycetia bacterium]